MSVLSFMEYLKAKSAIIICNPHGNLKYKFLGDYYVSTVSFNTTNIYIKEQQKQYQIEKKWNTKE